MRGRKGHGGLACRKLEGVPSWQLKATSPTTSSILPDLRMRSLPSLPEGRSLMRASRSAAPACEPPR